MREDQTATAKVCGKFENMQCKDATEVQGSWMAFYDQAFKVELNNGQRFLTNFRYSVKTGQPAKIGSGNYLGLEIDDYDRFYSDCDQTMVGLYNMREEGGDIDSYPVGCFYGVKTDVDKPAEQQVVQQVAQDGNSGEYLKPSQMSD